MTFLSVEKIFSAAFFALSLVMVSIIALQQISIDVLGLTLVIIVSLCSVRLLWLLKNKTRKSKSVIKLSDKILSSLDNEACTSKKNIIKRISNWDFIAFSFTFLSFALWGVYCTTSPNEIASIKTLHIEFGQFFKEHYQMETAKISAIDRSMPYLLGLMSIFLLTWLQLSLSASRTFIRNSLLLFLPVFLIGIIILAMMIGRVFMFQWPDTNFWKGGGFGIAEPIMLLHPRLADESISFFMVRFFELGFVGAYGAYLILMVPLSVFFHVLTVRRRRKTLAYIGFSTVSLLVMMDLFWLYHTYNLAVMLMGWFVVVICWGQSGYKTPHIQR